MNVLVVEPGYFPYEKEVKNDVNDLQAIVGGYIQAIYPFKDNVTLVCNEDGIAQRLKFNRTVPERQYGGIFGTFFICGISGEHFTSLTPEQMKTYKTRFQKAEIVIAVNGGKPIIAKVDALQKHLPGKPKHPPKSPKR